VCDCGGLGFVPSPWPNGGEALAPYKGNVFPPHIIPTSYRSESVYEVCAEHHVMTDDAARRLFNVLFDSPETRFYYFQAKEHPTRTRLDEAIDAGLILEGSTEFFFYARDPAKCDFMRIEPHALDVSHVECLFAFEKELLTWETTVASGPMYVRTELRLSERGRRHIEASRRELEAKERADDVLPFEAKPGLGGFNVDILRRWPWLRRRYADWRQRRRNPKQLP